MLAAQDLQEATHEERQALVKEAVEAASELVADFKSGVFWVGLASIKEPAVVIDKIAETVGARSGLAEHIAVAEPVPGPGLPLLVGARTDAHFSRRRIAASRPIPPTIVTSNGASRGGPISML